MIIYGIIIGVGGDKKWYKITVKSTIKETNRSSTSDYRILKS